MSRWKQIRPRWGHASGLTLVAGLALCAVPAAAQLVPLLQGRAWPGLSAEDVNRLHTAELRLFEDRSIGSIERWRNPDTGNAGKVELVRKYEAKGIPCRGVRYTLRFTEKATTPDNYVLNWCRQQSGDWKIVPSGPPE